MRIDVFTIFPELVGGLLGGRPPGPGPGPPGSSTSGSMTCVMPPPTPDGRWTTPPSGVGPGWFSPRARSSVRWKAAQPPRPLYLLGPRGRRFDQTLAVELAARADSPPGGFSLLCGRYEGVDERVVEHLVDGEISIGDYVLAGGEVAALVIIEAVSRLLPGTMGNEASATEESFSSGLLEHPHYTRPAVFRGWEEPGGPP